jgi:hypothetical protein
MVRVGVSRCITGGWRNRQGTVQAIQLEDFLQDITWISSRGLPGAHTSVVMGLLLSHFSLSFQIEIEHWVSIVSHGIDNTSASRTLCASHLRTLTTSAQGTSAEHLIRLPSSLTSMEKHTFIVAGFDNLKSAVEPMSEEDKKSLLVLLIEELNDLFPVNLCTDIVCDRYLDNDNNVFLEEPTDRTDLQWAQID